MTSRRDFIAGMSLAGVSTPAIANAERILAGETRSGSSSPSQQSERLPGRHSVLDSDHPYIFVDTCMQIWPDAQLDVAHRHGVSAYGVTAWSPPADVTTALEGIMYWHWVAREHPNLVVIETTDDIRQAKRDGKAGLLLAAQDGVWISNELHRVQAFQKAGLRIMLLAYNANNQLCDGCLDRTNGGLSRVGELVVDECNKVGIVLDCTHTGKRATLEILERSEKPCIYTHSNPSALSPNPRNIDDEQIRACTSRGGVVGLVSWGPLVMRPGTTHWPTLDEFIEMIDHVVQMTGNTDHVGIGTDMSLGTYPDHGSDPWGHPEIPNITEQYDRHVTDDIRSHMRNVNGFSDYAEIVTVTERLLERGYSDNDVHKIVGENFLRVFDQVWQ